MNEIPAMWLARHYLFPLFMAMALFLLDVRHELEIYGQQPSSMFYKSFVTCLIVFVFAVAFSILFNNLFLGWASFMLSWIALSVLKMFSLAETEICGTIIES